MDIFNDVNDVNDDAVRSFNELIYFYPIIEHDKNVWYIYLDSDRKYHDTIFYFLKHHNNFIYFIIVEVLFK